MPCYAGLQAQPYYMWLVLRFVDDLRACLVGEMFWLWSLMSHILTMTMSSDVWHETLVMCLQAYACAVSHPKLCYYLRCIVFAWFLWIRSGSTTPLLPSS